MTCAKLKLVFGVVTAIMLASGTTTLVYLLHFADLEGLSAPAGHVPMLQHEMHHAAEVQGRRLGFADFQDVTEVELEPALQPAVQP